MLAAREARRRKLKYKNTTFNVARHREPQAYGLVVERNGAIPPPPPTASRGRWTWIHTA
jgi:hypothetical protein